MVRFPLFLSYFLVAAIFAVAMANRGIAAEVDFPHEVVPIIRQHCGKCHTGDQKKGSFSFNSRESLLAGGESGKVVVLGKSRDSDLVKRLTSSDKDLQMPPEGPRVPPEQIAILQRWIDANAPWEEGFTFGKRSYEPPLKPRRPELSPVVDGRKNPVDRIIDAYLAEKKLARPKAIDDATFARRAWLDLIGLLPTTSELDRFLADSHPEKRSRLVRELLDRDMDYAEHWLTFWNDLLRNDYTGTGFITGGRKQISKWLYDALANNMPFDQFTRELIAPPTPESRGFIDGIRWRGEVSAGQTVEIQFAQSVSQSLLGINLKCASCHDSFVDRWKLDEAYGLAAIYSDHTLEIHRCDKPIGKTATAAWLFPEIGQVDAKAAQPERLKQLAALMTHPENGRFPRTIVNRLWHRMMGRGIVHPTNAMQNEPWNADLLDFLATNLVDNKYDLKKTFELIATSQAYQSQAQIVTNRTDDQGYVYGGPRAKRLTSEQFVDAVWQLTETAPTKIDAPVLRGKAGKPQPASALNAKWVWSVADSSQSPAGETITFHKTVELKQKPVQAIGAISCDNSYTLFVNGKNIHEGTDWENPDSVLLTAALKAGKNELTIVAKNGGTGPNPAALFFEARLQNAEPNAKSSKADFITLDESWQWTKSSPDKKGAFVKPPTDWKPAAVVNKQETWSSRVGEKLSGILARGLGAGQMVRASLVKSDFLMRSLGRPNREQIVSVRPDELTTLEAIDLSNGEALNTLLSHGSKTILAKSWASPDAFVSWLYRSTLCRNPTPVELKTLRESLGPKLTEQGIQDALWSVLMLPDFQYVR